MPNSRVRLFGTDGIRDLAGQGLLAPGHVVRIGRALARFAAARSKAAPRVAVGRDPRRSGPDVVRALARGLAAQGARVDDLGVVPSPVVAWSAAAWDYDLSIAVSASHNSEEWNGIKPFLAGGAKPTLEEEDEVGRLVESCGEDAPDVATRAVDGAARYGAETAAWLAGGPRPRGALVVDLAAGAASRTAPTVLSRLGLRPTLLHPEGSRPINDACGTEHPEAWLERVRKDGVPGMAFDGDADRVLLADRHGEVLDGDDLLALLAEDLLERDALPGSLVVGTVMTNLGLVERLEALGARLERVPVGDRQVAQRMRETGAALGGEPSGHVVLPRPGPRGPVLVGDALVAGVRALQAAARLGVDLTEARRRRPRSPQVLRNVRLAVRRPVEECPALLEAIRAAERALGASGRVLVRWSGTEPVLRIMVEGQDPDDVDGAVASVEAAALRALSATAPG